MISTQALFYKYIAQTASPLEQALTKIAKIGLSTNEAGNLVATNNYPKNAILLNLKACFIVRHGSTYSSTLKLVQGATEGIELAENKRSTDLTPIGIDEAQKTATTICELIEANKTSGTWTEIDLQNIHFVISPAKRAQDTAAIIIAAIQEKFGAGITVMRSTNQKASPISFGDCENTPLAELSTEDDAAYKAQQKLIATSTTQGGETPVEVLARQIELAEEINQKFSKNDIVFVVGHGASLSLFAAATGTKTVCKTNVVREDNVIQYDVSGSMVEPASATECRVV